MLSDKLARLCTISDTSWLATAQIPTQVGWPLHKFLHKLVTPAQISAQVGCLCMNFCTKLASLDLGAILSTAEIVSPENKKNQCMIY
jgi:hypothetical protein